MTHFLGISRSGGPSLALLRRTETRWYTRGDSGLENFQTLAHRKLSEAGTRLVVWCCIDNKSRLSKKSEPNLRPFDFDKDNTKQRTRPSNDEELGTPNS